MSEIDPDDVRRMLPIWHQRATLWHERLVRLARERGVPMGGWHQYIVTNDDAYGVAFEEDTIAWVEYDSDGDRTSFEVPIDVVRTDTSRDVWLDEWLATELRKADAKASLAAEQRRIDAEGKERAERAEYERLRAKYEETA